MVAGGIITTMNILVVLIAYLTPCDNKIVAGLWSIVSLGMFVLSIWGSVVVFGKLNEYLTLLENENSDLLKLSS